MKSTLQDVPSMATKASGAPSTKPIEGIVEFVVVSTAKNVIIRVTAKDETTIEITVSKDDLERAFLRGRRGLKLGISSSATFELPLTSNLEWLK